VRTDTRAVHLGVGYDHKGAISVPVYQTATFQHPALGRSTGFDYSRSGNPTRRVLEDGIAALEGGCRGFAYASGMAAIANLLMLFSSGDHLIFTEDLYGGTYRLLEQVFNQYGLQVTYVDTSDLEAVAAALRENTRAIFIETPTNPLLKVADIGATAQLAGDRGLLFIVDNTFLSPYLQKPLELGADVVVHSATKYLGGHNDLVAGLVVVKEEKLAEKVYFLQNSVGAVLGPLDSWLLIRGIKTLGIRLERQQENARVIAGWLTLHPRVQKVYYPGLPEHPGYKIMQKQSRGFGAMVSFEVMEEELVKQVLERTRLISFAESLGGVESLITFPAVQTHAEIKEEIRERLGINNRLLRLSVGIEAVEDLLADLEVALS